MADFLLKEGDREPDITATLPTNLTGKTVKFSMVKQSDGTVKINGVAATVVSAADGTVSYAWGATDTDTAGTYLAEWEVTTTAGGEKETFPKDSNLVIKITADLV